MSTLAHIADRVLNRPLMLLPEKLALIAQVLDGRIGIDASELRDLDVGAAQRDGPDASRFVGSPAGPDGRTKSYRVEKGVAIIPVLGSLVNRGAWIGARSGLTSYEGLGFQLDQAAADHDVRSTVLDIDSPGGEAVGSFEVADKVRSLAKVKSVVAVVNGMAASAAYAIASAASRIITTSSGVSGSIGVVILHADYSLALQQKGIRPTLIHAGARKIDGNPYQPLTDDVKAELKLEVDRFYDLFVATVAKGRNGMTTKAVRATEARTYIGADAVKAGLADSVGSFETVLAELVDNATKPTTPEQSVPTPSGLSMQASLAIDVRTDAERALILEAGRNSGAEKLATILADFKPSSCTLQAALSAIEFNAHQQAQNELHDCGLYLPHLQVKGGPLFADNGSTGNGAADHGWGGVVDGLNMKLKN